MRSISTNFMGDFSLLESDQQDSSILLAKTNSYCKNCHRLLRIIQHDSFLLERHKFKSLQVQRRVSSEKLPERLAWLVVGRQRTLHEKEWERLLSEYSQMFQLLKKSIDLNRRQFEINKSIKKQLQVLQLERQRLQGELAVQKSSRLQSIEMLGLQDITQVNSPRAGSSTRKQIQIIDDLVKHFLENIKSAGLSREQQKLIVRIVQNYAGQGSGVPSPRHISDFLDTKETSISLQIERTLHAISLQHWQWHSDNKAALISISKHASKQIKYFLNSAFLSISFLRCADCLFIYLFSLSEGKEECIFGVSERLQSLRKQLVKEGLEEGMNCLDEVSCFFQRMTDFIKKKRF